MISSIAGRPILQAAIYENVDGAWVATLQADSEEPVSGSVELVVGEASWSGTVVRGDVESGRWVGEVVGGAGGLEKAVPAQYYVRTPYASILADVLSLCGERLDPAEHQPQALARIAERWQRMAGTARSAIGAIAKAAGCSWRITRAGGVAFVQSEVWTPITHEHVELRANPGASALEISPTDAPLVRPGTTLGGRKAYTVETHVSGKGVRQTIITAKDADPAIQLGDALTKGLRRAVDYSQIYPCKVIQQDADGTVHLMPDDERVRGSGLTHVPLRHGIPGLTIRIVPGSRAALFFEDGDPSKPACGLWPDGSSVLEVALSVGAKLTLTAAQTALGATPNPTQSFVRGEAWVQYFDAFVQALTSALGSITPGPATGGGAPAVAALNAALSAMAPLKTQLLSLTIKGE